LSIRRRCDCGRTIVAWAALLLIILLVIGQNSARPTRPL
jgi:hypothetical protein